MAAEWRRPAGKHHWFVLTSVLIPQVVFVVTWLVLFMGRCVVKSRSSHWRTLQQSLSLHQQFWVPTNNPVRGHPLNVDSRVKQHTLLSTTYLFSNLLLILKKRILQSAGTEQTRCWAFISTLSFRCSFFSFEMEGFYVKINKLLNCSTSKSKYG